MAPPFKKQGFKTQLLGKKNYKKSRKTILQEVRNARWTGETFLSIEAPPSLLPAKKYCDITGLHAPYTDPRTKLHYHSKLEYAQIRRMTRAQVTDLLDLRQAETNHVQML